MQENESDRGHGHHHRGRKLPRVGFTSLRLFELEVLIDIFGSDAPHDGTLGIGILGRRVSEIKWTTFAA